MRKSSEDKEEEKKKKTPQEVAEKMQILDHNLKAYKALIKSFKKPTGLVLSIQQGLGSPT